MMKDPDVDRHPEVGGACRRINDLSTSHCQILRAAEEDNLGDVPPISVGMTRYYPAGDGDGSGVGDGGRGGSVTIRSRSCTSAFEIR